MKEIIIDIPLKGIASGNSNIKAEAHGISGFGCVDATNKIMKEVAEVKSTDKTPEYYQVNDSSASVGF